MDALHNDFEPNFILFASFTLLLVILVTWKLPNLVQQQNSNQEEDAISVTQQQEQQNDHEQPRNDEEQTAAQGDNQQDAIDPEISAANRQSIGHLARTLLGNPRVWGFLIETVVMGAGMATVEGLLFLYMVQDLQTSNLLCGLSVGINVLMELPIFAMAPTILRLLGHDGMLAVSMVCFFGRVYGYTLLTPDTKYLILPLEATHGITFALFWVASTNVSKALIVQVGAWNTTIPMIVQTLYSSVGVGLGSTMGGWAMQVYGARAMYRFVASMVAVLFLLHMMASIVTRVWWHTGFLPDHPSECRRGRRTTIHAENDNNDSEEPLLSNAQEPTGENDSNTDTP
uniref:Major facilitator superfamily associated domain-containing protein n=1 Tax=Entomoneis paludosa TaxID=265537 RepID=A0A7S2YHV7_9STRA